MARHNTLEGNDIGVVVGMQEPVWVSGEACGYDGVVVYQMEKGKDFKNGLQNGNFDTTFNEISKKFILPYDAISSMEVDGEKVWPNGSVPRDQICLEGQVTVQVHTWKNEYRKLVDDIVAYGMNLKRP